MSYDEATEVVKPTDGSFDLPPSPIAAKLAEVLLGRTNAALAMRCDEIDAAFRKSVAKRVAVGRLVVDERAGNEVSCGRVEQRLDEIHLRCAGRVDVDRKWQATSVGEDHELGSFTAFGLADQFAPFLAGENVPSAKPSRLSLIHI